MRDLAANTAHFLATWPVWLAATVLVGCGTTKSQLATNQLVMSDAVDRAVANIDFSRLAGETVYLDTQFVKSVKGLGFVNGDYIIGSLRQQIAAARCLLQEDKSKAEFILEARVGALGSDDHNVVYGIPPSQGLSTAASLLPNAPSIPTIPEISLAKKTDEVAAAKIAIFAYRQENREFVWQSGISQARSSAKDIWLFGAGPFQSGAIHDHTRFAGEEINIPLFGSRRKESELDPLALYRRQVEALPPAEETQMAESRGEGDPSVKQARFDEPAKPAGSAGARITDSQPKPAEKPAATKPVANKPVDDKSSAGAGKQPTKSKTQEPATRKVPSTTTQSATKTGQKE